MQYCPSGYTVNCGWEAHCHQQVCKALIQTLRVSGNCLVVEERVCSPPVLCLRQVRAWEAFAQLDSKVKNLLVSLRAVAELQNPAIRARHWHHLMAATGVQFTMDQVFFHILLSCCGFCVFSDVHKCGQPLSQSCAVNIFSLLLFYLFFFYILSFLIFVRR